MSKLELARDAMPETATPYTCVGHAMRDARMSAAALYLLAEHDGGVGKAKAHAVAGADVLPDIAIHNGQERLTKVLSGDEGGSGTLVMHCPDDLSQGAVWHVECGKAYKVMDAFLLTMVYMDIVKRLL